MTAPLDFLSLAGGADAVSRSAADARQHFGQSVFGRLVPEAMIPTTVRAVDLWRTSLNAIEVEALQFGDVWRTQPGSDRASQFRVLCSQAFDLRRGIGLAGAFPDRTKDALQFAALAILGQRAEDWRRWASENDGIPVPPIDNQTSWAERLFYRTSEAFLLLVRKDGWNDLRRIAEFIAELRAEQKQYEESYLARENGIRQTAAFELISFYHFAKAVETAGQFTGTGQPKDARDEIDLQMRHSIEAADLGGIAEWAILLRWLHEALQGLVHATIWHQLAAYNHRITDFKRALTSPDAFKPLFELLPPQRDAIARIMNASLRALVVQMPTSSGKTLLAQFRILQTKINYPKGWVAYLAPTRALVNQIASRLRRAFEPAPIGLRVEIASPAEEFDVFETELLKNADTFDILVTTPEKLDLIIRSGAISLTERPLGLVVLDEAQHIGESGRGPKAELLLSTINSKSPDTALLLLTPFIKNAAEVAKWLEANPDRSSEISPTLAADWQPNDLLISMAWVQGKRRRWSLEIESLHTSRPTIEFARVATLEPATERNRAVSSVSGRGDVAAEVARTLASRGSTLVLVQDPAAAWKVARTLSQSTPDGTQSEKIGLVKRYVAAEYGEKFALLTLLDKRIAVHHAGISEEARILVEWLMDEGELSHLVATSTLAQGINFDLANVVLASLSVKQGLYNRPMTFAEFWNVSGRAGRVHQDPLGVVVIATPDENHRHEARTFVGNKITELVSALEKLVLDAQATGRTLDLAKLAWSDSKWSAFVQYLSHCYRQIGQLSGFLAETDKILRRTYAYQRLQAKHPMAAAGLLEAVRAYGQRLSQYKPGTLAIVDSTGFSPESVQAIAAKKSDYMPKSFEEWSPSKLFRANGSINPIIGRLLSINEVNLVSHPGVDSKIISEVVSAWVSGASIAELAKLVPSQDVTADEHLSNVAKLVFKSISHNTSWGLSAVQSLAEIDETKLTENERAMFRSLPAMVYYGCQTVDGVLMRSHGVPRIVSEKLGAEYRREVGKSPNETKASRDWLLRQDERVWEAAAPAGRQVRGRDVRNVWRIINGLRIE